jgi:hypothetical protein
LAAHRSLPVYTDKQTFSARVGMSQRCRKEANASQHGGLSENAGL